MGATDIRSWDSGQLFVVRLNDPAGVAINFSGASTSNLLFMAPDGSCFVRTGSVWLDPSDSIWKVRYTSTGEFNNGYGGEWRVQANIIMSSGDFSSTEGKFTVSRKICS